METHSDRETALAILEADHTLVRFYIPPEARWLVVNSRKPFEWLEDLKPKSLGEQLTTTIRQIVKHNPRLAEVIDTIDYNETRNGEREISDAALRGIILRELFTSLLHRLMTGKVRVDNLEIDVAEVRA